MGKKHVILGFVLIILLSIILYDVAIPSYELVYDEGHTYLEVKGKKYYFNRTSLEYAELGKRIGYVKDDPSLGKIFFSKFEHGVYEIESDSEQRFLRIKKFGQDKEYVMLVREDVDILKPMLSDISYITWRIDGKKIINEEVISEIVKLYYSDGEENNSTHSATEERIYLYTDDVPQKYCIMDILHSSEPETYWLRTSNLDQEIQLPLELVEKIRG